MAKPEEMETMQKEIIEKVFFFMIITLFVG